MEETDMSKTNKIKSLLALKGVKSVEYTRTLGLSRPQALNTKYSRDAFSGDDLIRLADLTGTRLAFIDPATREPLVTFDQNDVKKEKPASHAAHERSARRNEQHDVRMEKIEAEPASAA